ncbi:RNA polymerase sigma factor [Tamlana sp. 2201CG12-4]|uniref:RNA polymerase sigma factor n=1 Tax=Tamlana sp. 2201CG12-4 TaxID=3112582 RepID=UPI002DBCD7A2|nr:RNA polymerase sigma factor [Tamlana sp. 2201CG12-4]MEC3905594.1 RNA polymerase sigma factor [Tamlana sp. 2201CG12-4]
MKSFLKVIQLHKNESLLIKKAIKNNREAQHMLFELHAPKMLSVCRYYIKDMQHAEEVMLNGFFKMFSNLKSYRSEGSFEGWIRQIMVRESISFLRQQKHIEFPTDELEFKNDYTDDINSGIEVDQIQQIIDDLPEGYKIVFVMYAVQGYKHHEISEMLNISAGTSKSQLFKARKLLQEKIKELNNLSYGTQ